MFTLNFLYNAPDSNNPQRQFKLLQQLGKGGEGCVYLAQVYNQQGIPNNKQVAIKVQNGIKDEEFNFLKNIIKYQREYEVDGSDDNLQSFIIRAHDYFQFQGQVLIIQEVGEMDLYEYMKSHYPNQLNEEDKKQILIQITRVVNFLHSNNIFHRDIKPENFIKVGNRFKLIDFGLVKNYVPDRLKTSNVGTPLFQAPEVIESSQYTKAVDIWSLGCVFYEILSGKALIQVFNHSEIQQVIINHKNNVSRLNDIINQLPTQQQLKQLIIKMISPSPNDRPTAKEVLDKLDAIFKPNNQNVLQASMPVANQPNQQPPQTNNFSNQPAINLQQQQFNQNCFPRNQNFPQTNQQQFPNQQINQLLNQNQIEQIKQGLISEINQQIYQQFQTLSQTLRIDSQNQVKEAFKELQQQYLLQREQDSRTYHDQQQKLIQNQIEIQQPISNDIQSHKNIMIQQFQLIQEKNQMTNQDFLKQLKEDQELLKIKVTEQLTQQQNEQQLSFSRLEEQISGKIIQITSQQFNFLTGKLDKIIQESNKNEESLKISFDQNTKNYQQIIQELQKVQITQINVNQLNQTVNQLSQSVQNNQKDIKELINQQLKNNQDKFKDLINQSVQNNQKDFKELLIKQVQNIQNGFKEQLKLQNQNNQKDFKELINQQLKNNQDKFKDLINQSVLNNQKDFKELKKQFNDQFQQQQISFDKSLNRQAQSIIKLFIDKNKAMKINVSNFLEPKKNQINKIKHILANAVNRNQYLKKDLFKVHKQQFNSNYNEQH